MTKVEILRMQKRVASKMMAAIAMLLVSTIMLGGATYAWFAISVAPEAREIKTTVGTNGALEIALQSAQGEGALSRADIKSARGDSRKSAVVRNTRWGNVIDLNTYYGLETISLYPSRINVNPGNTSVNTDGYLSVPEFGVDGRISRLDSAKFLTYNDNAAAPFTEGRTYGVNILGTVGEEAAENETITYHYRRSMIRDEAAGYLEEYRTSLRSDMISMLESQQVGIFNLLLRATQLLNNNGEITGNTWTADNVATAKAIITRMITITRNSEVSLKWALLARAAADDSTYPPDDDEAMAGLGELYRNFLTYPLSSGVDGKSIRSIAVENGYDDLVAAVDSIIRAESQLGYALTYISNDDTVTNACLLIIDVQNTLLKNGSEIETDGPGTGNPATGTARTLYAKEGNTSYGMIYNASHGVKSDYLYFIGNPAGETLGLFSIMANLLGDYQSTEKSYFSARPLGFYDDSNNGARTQYTLYIRATGETAVSRFNTSDNRGVLGTVYDDIMDYDPGNAMISFSIEKKDGLAYGYSIDLAFRASENCDLLLSQRALDRILGTPENNSDGNSDGDEVFPAHMGSGSNAEFTLSGDLIGSQSDRAKELIRNIYIVLIDTDSGGILGIVGVDDPEVVLERATGDLAIYEPVITEGGILTKGNKRTSNVITALESGKTSFITAIIFLNGDTLPGGAMGSTQSPSLYGTVNLQFSSSAELTPLRSVEFVE